MRGTKPSSRSGLAIASAWPSFVTFLNDIVQPRMATRANAVLYLGGAIAHFTTNETALFTSAIASITLIPQHPAVQAGVR